MVRFACWVFVPHSQVKLAPKYCCSCKSYHRRIIMAAIIWVRDNDIFSANLFPTFSVYFIHTVVKLSVCKKQPGLQVDWVNCQWPQGESWLCFSHSFVPLIGNPCIHLARHCYLCYWHHTSMSNSLWHPRAAMECRKTTSSVVILFSGLWGL